MEGSIFGAWDYFVSASSVKQMEECILSYKRGKFLENVLVKVKLALDRQI